MPYARPKEGKEGTTFLCFMVENVVFTWRKATKSSHTVK